MLLLLTNWAVFIFSVTLYPQIHCVSIKSFMVLVQLRGLVQFVKHKYIDMNWSGQQIYN